MDHRTGTGTWSGWLCWEVGAACFAQPPGFRFWEAFERPGRLALPRPHCAGWRASAETGFPAGSACPGQDLLPAAGQTMSWLAGEGWPRARAAPPLPATQEDSVSWSEPSARPGAAI